METAEQGAITLESPYYLTEFGIMCKRNTSVIKLADWQTIHDRLHLVDALNDAYQTGWRQGWKERKR